MRSHLDWRFFQSSGTSGQLGGAYCQAHALHQDTGEPRERALGICDRFRQALVPVEWREPDEDE